MSNKFFYVEIAYYASEKLRGHVVHDYSFVKLNILKLGPFSYIYLSPYVLTSQKLVLNFPG